MRALFISIVALIACLSFAGCAGNAIGTLDATKVVMDDNPPSDGNVGDDGGDSPDTYIWYDSEGDDFD